MSRFEFFMMIASVVVAGLQRVEVEFMIMSVLVASGMVALTLTKNVRVHTGILVASMLIVVGGLFTEMSYHDNRWLTP